MKKTLKLFLGELIVIQILLTVIGNDYFSKHSNPIIINISLTISLILGTILMSKMVIKELKLNEKVTSIDYFRNLDFKEIKPIEVGMVTKKSKLGFNSALIIILQLIEKNILVNKYYNNKMYISLNNNITLDDIEFLEKEEQAIIKIIFTGKDDKNEYEINQIIKIIQNDIGKSHYLNLTLKEINDNITKKYFQNHGIEMDIDKKILTIIIISMLITSIGNLPNVISSITQQINLSIIYMLILYTINILIIIYFLLKKIPNAKYHDEIKKLNGLYNFLNEFSNLKNLDIKYIEIYDKYYLYALGLGITDKIEKQYNFKSIDNSLKSNFKYLFYIEGEKND